MKKLILNIALILSFTAYFAQAEEIALTAIPERMTQGSVMLITETNTQFFARQLIDIELNDQSNMDLLLSKTNDFIKLRLPEDITSGEHQLKITLDDGIFGIVDFEIYVQDTTINSNINGFDPDPDTQNGKPRNLGKDPKPIKRSTPVFNPSGGHINSGIPCTELHEIDGDFTEFETLGFNEWEGIIPLKGQFSNLYLDYCAEDGILYLMNDWILGNGIYDSSSCYNLFEFVTGGGRERWMVKVYNSIEKGVQVILNGEDVSLDTNILIGGRYGFNDSPLEEEEHTMWEFGLKVTGGIYIMRVYKDEVGWREIDGPKTRIICDENGEGWGLVQAPETVVGNLDENGITVQKDEKYIPAAGAAGLITEPTHFSGNFTGNTATIYADGQNMVENNCNDIEHTVDGQFTEYEDGSMEWQNSAPAIGMYSNLYANYCDGILYILNDWHVADKEPFEKNCYNLFELYTDNGREHWGIYVYHDVEKGIKVFRNGEDVSNDTTIVLGGAFGFGTSPRVPDTEHSIYEFGIKVKEGNWHLYLCDPAPSSFCDESDEPLPRRINFNMGLREDENGETGSHTTNLVLDDNTFELTLGTTDALDELYSRKFRCVITFDKNKIPLNEYNLAEAFELLNSDIVLSIAEETNNSVTILGESESNLSGSGDLIKLTFESLMDKGISTDIEFEIFFQNRNTILFQQDLQNVTISIPTSVESDIIEKIEYYPNPVSGNNLQIRINSKQIAIANIRAFDVNGSTFELYNGKINSDENILNLTLKNFSSGTYIISVRYADFQRSFPIVIIK
jgi:hypothetical protein